MASVFTRIIAGELPARFVWRDQHCVAFLSHNPLKPAHTLVVPRAEIEDWLELDAEVRDHVKGVAAQIGGALKRAYEPTRVGLLIAGLEVAHVHIHLVPIWDAHDLDFDRAQQDPDPAGLDEAAATLRAALVALDAQGITD